MEDFQRQNKESKLEVLFQLLDTDQNGLVGVEELEKGFFLIKMEGLPPSEVKLIAQQTLAYADGDQDGFLNFKEFSEFYNATLNISI